MGLVVIRSDDADTGARGECGETHLQRISTELRVDTRTAAVRAAVEQDLIRLD
ncbi:hypothetical protein [Nocardiopsis chromatogenes]|uniref:hypothetical protein n=1 Tax=Nocardiopsis chromatogenes TaxID=280239 RepID=UPI00034AD640|nr:hypothetical protein [Nocardiopsis chromatogenes]